MKIVALYDHTCGLCIETKKIFQKLDWFHQVKWLSLQDGVKKMDHIPFEEKELRKELHVVEKDGTVLKGFYAVRKLLVLFPASFLIGIAMYIPFVHLAGIPVYRWIARNRHRFLKKKCKDGNCSL